MVIVGGHITVEPQQRESYLAGCVRIVEQARRAVGCLDVAICGVRSGLRYRRRAGRVGEVAEMNGPDGLCRNR
jgi:hypothetical protein